MTASHGVDLFDTTFFDYKPRKHRLELEGAATYSAILRKSGLEHVSNGSQYTLFVPLDTKLSHRINVDKMTKLEAMAVIRINASTSRYPVSKLPLGGTIPSMDGRHRLVVERVNGEIYVGGSPLLYWDIAGVDGIPVVHYTGGFITPPTDTVT